VRAGKDDQGLAAGESLMVAIGDGEVAFNEAVWACVFDDEGQVSGGHGGFTAG